MELFFASTQLARVFASNRDLIREYGPIRAKRIQTRLQQLRVAEKLSDLREVTARVHELSGDRAGSIALDLDGPYRLLVEPVTWTVDSGGRLDWDAVKSVVITEIVDYH